jgi:hypothetical protein
MEDERTVKNILNGKFHKTGSKREPRTRWEDVVQRDGGAF